ncbi:hypothetical protein HAX54_031433, partial [Datura stramonium]|nr:hypothetical protein [Datura stramonium]
EKNSYSIPRLHFDLVENGKYTKYPWGKESFDNFIKSISKKMDASKKYYRFAGMSLALQVWLYECCSHVDSRITNRVDNRIPIILNWKTNADHPRFENLMQEMFRNANNL